MDVKPVRTSAPRDLPFAEQRDWMVQHQLQASGVRNARVLAAMQRIPRELFVPDQDRAATYYDGALPIGEGQTISQPYVVAHMTELLHLRGDEKVLEIGTGSGYQTALLSLLARSVYTVERLDALAQRARQTLTAWGAANVQYRVGDGSLGWAEHSPYDAILLTCAAPDVPQPLLEQLADGGRLLAPVGPLDCQNLLLVQRRGDTFSREELSPVVFVPLLGAYGW
ncbi:MAG: protein-L-isoaspartate(D-aspartate) O-methyltransferase [Anaerolineae bacterium]